MGVITPDGPVYITKAQAMEFFGLVDAPAKEELAMAQRIEELEEYKAWYDEAMVASNVAGFVGMSAAETIRAQDDQLTELRAL